MFLTLTWIFQSRLLRSHTNRLFIRKAMRSGHVCCLSITYGGEFAPVHLCLVLEGVEKAADWVMVRAEESHISADPKLFLPHNAGKENKKSKKHPSLLCQYSSSK